MHEKGNSVYIWGMCINEWKMYLGLLLFSSVAIGDSPVPSPLSGSVILF